MGCNGGPSAAVVVAVAIVQSSPDAAWPHGPRPPRRPWPDPACPSAYPTPGAARQRP